MSRKYTVNPNIERLSDFIRERMNLLRLSTHEVSRRTGGVISHSTVANMVNGRIQQPEGATLDAIARGISVDKRDLIDILHGVSKPSDKANTACLVELPKEVWESIEAKAKLETRTPIQQLTHELRGLFSSSTNTSTTLPPVRSRSGDKAINEKLPSLLTNARSRSISKATTKRSK